MADNCATSLHAHLDKGHEEQLRAKSQKERDVVSLFHNCAQPYLVDTEFCSAAISTFNDTLGITREIEPLGE